MTMTDHYRGCTLCPRRCGVDRTRTHGACGMGDRVVIARAALHMWEEPCISGERGAGTVFFVGCSLGCVYCQNGKISRGAGGHAVDTPTLADEFLRLQNEERANCIDLVTPTHFTPSAADAVALAKSRGLVIPVVWNSGGYESVEALRMLDGLVDVYLPDLKYISSELSAKYSHAPDYFDAASRALDEMFRQVGEPTFSDGRGIVEEGIMTRGMIVRHLVLPTHADDSKAVIKYLHNRFGDGIYISIMNQYTPPAYLGEAFPELSRPVTDEEYGEVVDYAEELGVENGFIQEGGSVGESFIPEFE